ncbi:MAG: hypothetical protein PVI75_00990 [Gammaproteobacteria bacterium]|jgi:hypothetical protein
MSKDIQYTKIYYNGAEYVKRYYEKIIKALYFIANLKVAGERSFLKYVAALQKLLAWLKQAITRHDLPIDLKFTVHELQARIIPLADPNLIEQSNFDENTLKLLAQLSRDIVAHFLKNARKGFATVVQQIIANAINHGQGNGNNVMINNDVMQQFSIQVFDNLTHNIVNSLNDPEPSAPEFEPDLFRDNVDNLIDATVGLTDDVANIIRGEIYNHIQLFDTAFRNMVENVTKLYVEVSGSSYDYGLNKLFGNKCEFFGSVLDEDEEDNESVFEHGNSFFAPPEKDYPNVPHWKHMYLQSEEEDLTQSSLDPDFVKYVY